MSEAQDVLWAGALRNGVAATIRCLRPDDRERVAAAVGKLDPESIYTRLFSHRKQLSEAGLNRIMAVDPGREVVLLVTTGARANETVIGSGRYIATDRADTGDCTAEVAFLVARDYQGLGIAGRLLGHLAELARQDGVVAFEADVLAENKSMLTVFARSALPMQKRYEGGVVHVRLSLDVEHP